MKKTIFLLLAFITNITFSNAQWHHANGPFGGGSIYSIVTNGSKIYAGTSGGVFLSPDNGVSWSLIGLSGKLVLSLALKGSDIIVGTYGFGIHVTTDDGANWTAINTGLPGYIIAQTLAVNDSKIYVGLGGKGVYVTSDNGANWNAINTGIETSSIRSIVIDGTNIFAGSFYEGVYLSTNDGQSWTLMNEGLTSLSVQPLAVSGSNIFAGTHGGVFLSNNYGATWSSVNTGLTSQSVLALAASGSTIYAGTSTGGLFKSINSGSSWNAVNNGLLSSKVTSIVISDTNVLVGTNYSSSCGGLYWSDNNGNTWQLRGVLNTYVNQLLATNTAIFAGTSSAGVFYSVDLGLSWYSSNIGLTDSHIYSLATNGTTIFAGTKNGVSISTDNGESWTAANDGMTSMTVSALVINNTTIYACTKSNGLFVSTDNGATWLYSSLAATAIYSLAVSGSNVYVGTQNGVYISTNSGTSWSFSDNGLTATKIQALATDGSTIFAGALLGGVFKSTDNGVSWTVSNNGLSHSCIHSLIIDGTNVFASTQGGVFVSANYGASWTEATTGITNFTIKSLAISGDNIFAGTYGGGVFKRCLMLTVNNETICTGASATLTAIQLLGDASNTNYLWSNGQTGRSIIVSPDTTTTYTVIATNGTLIDSAQSLVTVKPLPTITATGGTICYGDSIVLSAHGGNSYIWETGDSIKTIVVSPAITTLYSVIGSTTGIGCIDTAQATVLVNPIPETPIITRSSDTLMSSASSGNQWYKNNYHLWSATDSVYVCWQNGNYFVIVTLNGCSSDTSNIIDVNVGIDEIVLSNIITIFPNPSSKYLFIECQQKSEIEILDIEGHVIKRLNNHETKVAVDFQNFSSGVYIIKIKNDKGISFKKFIKQ